MSLIVVKERGDTNPQARDMDNDEMKDKAAKLAEPLIEEGKEVGAKVGEKLGEINLEEIESNLKEGGGFVVNMGQQVGTSVYKAGSTAVGGLKEVLASPQFAEAQQVVFENVSEVYSQGAEAAGELLALVRGVSLSVFDWVKLDVFRDFFQVIGLFFGGISWPNSFKAIGSFAATSAIDIRVWITSLSPLVFFWINALTSLACYGVFYYVSRQGDPNSLEDGLEVKNWVSRNKRAIQAQHYVLWVAISLYLPVSRNAWRVFTCNHLYEAEFADGCYTGNFWVYFIVALITTAAISGYMPYQCYQLIQYNKPEEVSFDEEGREKNYTDEDYRQDLDRDKSPYTFLYKGYERKWAFIII